MYLLYRYLTYFRRVGGAYFVPSDAFLDQFGTTPVPQLRNMLTNITVAQFMLDDINLSYSLERYKFEHLLKMSATARRWVSLTKAEQKQVRATLFEQVPGALSDSQKAERVRHHVKKLVTWNWVRQ